MASAHSTVAAPASHRPPLATTQPAVKGATSRANLILPTWANTRESRALLAAIAVERPERTRCISMTCCNEPAGYGYLGRNAAALRKIFDRAFDAMLVADDGKNRGALTRFLREHSADAVIARVLECGL